MAIKALKTNAMRQLDQVNILYSTRSYPSDDRHFDGEEVARSVGLPAGQVFKTLVIQGENRNIVVCCIPVNGKVHLKALAAETRCKRLALLPPEQLFSATGYVRGGCSPIGMKKQYATYIDRSALQYEFIAVSAGVRGTQMLLAPKDLIAYTGAVTGDFVQTTNEKEGR